MVLSVLSAAVCPDYTTNICLTQVGAGALTRPSAVYRNIAASGESAGITLCGELIT